MRKLSDYAKWMLNPLLKPFRPGKIVMFHGGRSGSRVLGTMLDRHPRIAWGHELFLAKRIEKYAARGSFDYRDVIRDHAYRAGLGFFGFEMKFRQMEQLNIEIPQFVEAMAGMQHTHYIVLERVNYLRQHTSSKLIAVRGKAHLKVGAENTLHQVILDHETLAERFDRFEKEFATLRQALSNHNVLELTYEEDIQHDPSIAFHKVCNFLGVDLKTIKPSLQRTNPYPLAEIITNYEEVSHALQGTRYAWMLKD